MQKNIILLLLLAATLFVPRVPITAQTLQTPLRAEENISENDMPYSVIALGETGVITVMKKNDLFSQTPQRSVCFYDENLQLRWKSRIPAENGYSCLGYAVEEDTLRLVLSLFPEKAKGGDAFLEVPLCLANGNFRIQGHKADISRFLKCGVEAVSIAPGPGKNWCFWADTRDGYVYCVYDPGSDTLYTKTLAGNEYLGLDAAFDTVHGRAFFLYRERHLNECNLYLQTVENRTMELRNTVIDLPQQEGVRLVDGRIILSGADEFIIAGVWNPCRNKQHTSYYDRGSETAGMFAVRYKNFSPADYIFKPYLDFPHLDKLLSAEENYKIATARQKAGGRPLLPDYPCCLKVFKSGNRYTLSAETFDRMLTTSTDVSYDFYGRMVPSTRTRFDGYLYKNAFCLSFDAGLKNLRTPVLDIQHFCSDIAMKPSAAVAGDSTGNAFTYCYINEGNAYYRRVGYGQAATAAATEADTVIRTEPVKNFRLPPLVAGDKTHRTWSETVLHWYGNNWLVYGHQQILNARRKGKSKQNVFYLTKLIENREP